MALIDFIKNAQRSDLYWMLALATLSGLANAALIIAVNEVTDVIAVGERPGVTAWGVFLLAFLIFYWGNRIAMLRANRVIEGLLKRLRARIMDHIRRSELRDIEQLGRGRLYSLVAHETNQLSVVFPLVIDGVQQLILLLVALVYLAFLSLPVALVFLVSSILALWLFQLIDRDYRVTLKQVHAGQAELLDAVGHVVHGGKELRLNQRKSDALFVDYRRLSRRTRRRLEAAGDLWGSLMMLGSIQVYTMLGLVIFVLPLTVAGFNEAIFKVIPVLLFCFGALSKIVWQWPTVARTDVGLRSILDIDAQLARTDRISPDLARSEAPRFSNFQSIHFEALTYSYRDVTRETTFTLGPLSLEVSRGEMLFLVGGNGSGKSSTLRLMTGLIAADSGSIVVDGALVSGTGLAGYRELFSAVFADFHLFDRFHGLDSVDPRRVNELIDQMGLSGKVGFDNDRFTTVSLSTGQRKRLGLILSLMEDRPIYVFDEWSAEQDVHFRAYFYDTVLPAMKAQGKTIIAVTHDDRYWNRADRVVKLDLGRVEWDRPGNALEG